MSTDQPHFDSYAVGGFTRSGDTIRREFATLGEAQAWAIAITSPGLVVSLFGWSGDKQEEIAAYEGGRLIQ